MFKDRTVRLLVFFSVILAGTVVALASPYAPGSRIVESLGINLATAGVVAVLIEAILRDEFLDEIRRELRSTVREIGIGQVVAPAYVSAFTSAHDRIDILAMTFTMGSKAYVQLVLDKIINEHCHIRVIIIDPESPLLEHRARDEPDHNGERIKQKVADTILSCEQLRAAYRSRVSFDDPPKGSFRLKAHRSIPYFAYSRMDAKAFLTPYSAVEYGVNCPVIEIREPGSALFDRLEKHFETIWERNDSRLLLDLGFVGMREADAAVHRDVGV